MKKLTLTFALFASIVLNAQISGNINYQNQNFVNPAFPEAQKPNPGEMLISVKGLANVKADSYVAIFSAVQVGKTLEEATGLIDSRISSALNRIKTEKNTESYVDVISLVPTYEYEVHNKVFSRKTYTEVPAGFEVRKNIHIKFTDAQQLEKFIRILAQSDIYDLVRVDYHASALENIRQQLEAKALSRIQEKLKKYELISGKSFENTERSVSESFDTKLPVEMYRTYEASRSSTLNLRKSANVNQAEKNVTQYYQPVLNKNFDFVINPVITEPAIQMTYEMKVLIYRNPVKNEKEYLIVTPNGDVRPLPVKS